MDASMIGISVIGSADGPTAIFVTGGWGGALAAAVLLLLAAVFIAVWLFRRKK